MKSLSERDGTLARTLGWAALGLGTAQVLAPRRVSQLLGVKPSGLGSLVMRIFGAREIASGLGILRRGAHRKQWLRARVVGDVLHTALLIREIRASRGARDRPRYLRLRGSLAGTAAVTLLDLLALRRVRP